MGLTGLKPRYCRMVFPLEAPGEKVPHHAVSRVCTHSSAGVPLPETASLTSESIFRSALTFLLLLLLGLLRPTWKNQANLPNSRFLIQLHLHSLLFQINEHIPRFWRLGHECHGGAPDSSHCRKPLFPCCVQSRGHTHVLDHGLLWPTTSGLVFLVLTPLWSFIYPFHIPSDYTGPT